jgi:hypothetical protein
MTASSFLANNQTSTIPLPMQGQYLEETEPFPTTLLDTALNNSQKLIKSSSSYEEYIKMYFKDTPVLIAIARCESMYRQYDETGAVLQGMVTPADTGAMQVNKYYHEKTAKRLGHNLDTIDGNLAYAKWLHAREGTAPWRSSYACWYKAELALK